MTSVNRHTRPQISPRNVRKRSDYTMPEADKYVETENTEIRGRDVDLAQLVTEATVKKGEALDPIERMELIQLSMKMNMKEEAPHLTLGGPARNSRRSERAREAAAIQAAARGPRGPQPPIKGSVNVDVGAIGSYKAPQPTGGRDLE